MRFSSDDTARLRRGLMKRGRDLAELLSQVLAGKKPPSLASLLAARPGMRPEEVLRMTLDAVEARRKLLDADDDHFGRCDICGVDLGLPALEQMPWADRCSAHSAQ